MDFLTDPIFTEFSRSEFIGGIDNEALDFGHLEQFIHVAASTGGGNVLPTISSVDVNDVLVTTSTNSSTNSGITQTQSHLPESPPDSGSEPPFSPADLQGLTLTSRANCPSSTIDSNPLIDSSPQLAVRPHVKPSIDLHALVQHLSSADYQHYNHNQQQHQHNHNMYQHNIYSDYNDQHAQLLAASSSHTQHGPTTSPNGQTSNGLYSPNNCHGRSKEHHPDHLLAIDRYQQPHTHLLVTSVNDIMDMEQHRSPYNRQMMLMATPDQQYTPSIIPSDVYMGTPGPMIEAKSTLAPVPLPTRKRKNITTVKPEPAPSISPICQQNLNPASPVSINLQQIGGLEGGSSISGSPKSSSFSPVTINMSLLPDNNSIDGNGIVTPNESGFVGSNNNDSSSESLPMQCIRFSPFQQHNWHTLCDQSLQELTMAHYRVDADKGFNFSISDDAFVCQKKNHFQITCHARLQGDAKFVRTSSGLEKIKSFHLHFYGVKLEAPNQIIRVEQSQSDRSKKPFHPVPIDLQSHLVSKVTVGRLHFSETTNNNMRKKGRPNPEQRYFQLVVGLHVHTHSGHFPVLSQGSERIIVRASNPGQFESDVELCWQRGITPESIYHAGRVGINTDRPDESLVIHGNLKVSGHIIQPSDSRAKQEISELDTALQLQNLQKIRIVRYRYEPEFALHSGLKSEKDNEEIVDTGVIAQEVREVLPDAVQEAGSIVLPSGQIIENFLLVNKDRILMENIGAVKELCKVTGSLETRIEQLEKINNRLMRIQEVDRNKRNFKHIFEDRTLDGDELCSNRTIQMMIIILVVIMATCLVAVSTLYFMEHSNQRYMKHYDRYDISHHLVSHDSILINNNQHSLNRNGYYANKNGKLIVHAHTSHTPLTPPIPPPIQSQISSSYHLLSQALPVSVIPAPYPAIGTGDGPSSDIYTIKSVKIPAERPVDELSLGRDKPVLPFLSNPMATIHSSNKTINNKNKQKWPLAETTNTVAPAVTSGHKFNDDPMEETLNISESSSEKVADSIPLPQDFENNSIDGTEISQKRETHEDSHNNVDQNINHEPISGSTTRSDAHQAPDSNVLGVTAESAAIDAEPTKLLVTNGNPTSLSMSPSLSSPSIVVVYKNAQRNTINDTINQHVNFTIETPPTTNKSHGMDTGDTDLQHLGNGNDSDDQNVSEPGVIHVITKSFSLPSIGLPNQCAKVKHGDISNCQSACFEREIRGHRHHNTTMPATPAHRSNIASAPSDVDSFQKPQSLIDGSPDTITSLERIEVDSDDDDDNAQTNLSESELTSRHENNMETVPLSLKDKQNVHKDCKRKVDMIESQPINGHKGFIECSSILPSLQANTFNVSLGCEEICLNSPTSLNITYKIPLSKYLKDTNIELQFVARANLHWTVCSNSEKTKRDGNSTIIPLNNGKLFPKNQNVSIFYLIIPDHGQFERLIELRAAMDSTKNLCREQADETKVLIQYNIRISNMNKHSLFLKSLTAFEMFYRAVSTLSDFDPTMFEEQLMS